MAEMRPNEKEDCQKMSELDSYYQSMRLNPNHANLFAQSMLSCQNMNVSTSSFLDFKPTSFVEVVSSSNVKSNKDSSPIFRPFQNGLLANQNVDGDQSELSSTSQWCDGSHLASTSSTPIDSQKFQAAQCPMIPQITAGTNNSGDFPLPLSSPTVRSSATPKMELVNQELWESFHQLTNEMVVNKAGRKMFPKIELRLSGLDPQAKYFIVLTMRLVDSNRYKFQGGCWSTAGHDNVPEHSNPVPHHEGLNSDGEFWMRNTVSFDRVKLTNRPKGEGSWIALNSMHKYQPILHLFDCSSKKALVELSPPILEFIAVTAYQSQAIINLKIRHNPFAKGFREGSARKRSLSCSPESKDSSSNSGVSPPFAKNVTQGVNSALLPLASNYAFPGQFNFAHHPLTNSNQQNFRGLNNNFYPQMLNEAANLTNGGNVTTGGQCYQNAAFGGLNHFAYQNYNQFLAQQNYSMINNIHNNNSAMMFNTLPAFMNNNGTTSGLPNPFMLAMLAANGANGTAGFQRFPLAPTSSPSNSSVVSTAELNKTSNHYVSSTATETKDDSTQKNNEFSSYIDQCSEMRQQMFNGGVSKKDK